MSVYAELADGRRLEFPDGTDPVVIQNTVKKVLGKSQTPPSKEWMERLQGQKPKESGLRDFLTGATGMIRGAMNTATSPEILAVRNQLQPEGFKTTESNAGDRLFHPQFANKDSGAYLAGSLVDPAAWAVGLGAAKALPYAKVLGNGVWNALKSTASNIAGGAIPGAIVGGLSNDNAASGAVLGGALNATLPGAVGLVASGIKKVYNATHVQEKAAEILKKILGKDLPAVKAATAAATDGITAAQAAAGVHNDVFNALDDLARRQDLENYYSRLDAAQKQELVDDLVRLAGGRTATEARQTVEASRKALGNVTEPQARAALKNANVAGRAKPVISRLEQKAEALGTQASGKVQDVRRLSRAGEIAEDVAQTGRMNLGGKPTPVLGRSGLQTGQPARYERGEELVDVAERGSQKAADDSLALGAASRESKAKAEQIKGELASRGLSPLDPKSVTGGIRRMLKDRRIGPSDINYRVLSSVADKIDEWTNKYGIIDAEALRTIRTNSINEKVKELMPGLDAKAQKARAASLLTKVKPMIDDAIEKAGGKGWRQYLFDFERNSRLIDRKKMGGVALRAFEKNPKKFESLVAGNEPEMVQRVFKTEYDLGLAMGTKDMQPLERAASALARDRSIREGAVRGEGGLHKVLGAHQARFRLPNWINRNVAITNRALEELETRVNEKTMTALLEAMKSGRNANNLLNVVPIEDRSKVIRVLMETQTSPASRAFLMGYLNAQEQ